MDYQETIEYLFEQLPMFQRKGPVAYKSGLGNSLRLDELYSYPHHRFKSVHIAGTNGKGSVSHMLTSVLQKAGYKTGLYTSPHLKDFRERIRVNGEMMNKQDVVEWVENFAINNASWKINPSFFELTVAMAFDHFANQGVDMAIVETGLGGRLDSTNILQPEVSVITNIGMDHTILLGDTLEKIAVEKAGIIKKKVPVIIGTTQEGIDIVFKQIAEEKDAPLFFADQEYIAEYAMLGLEGEQRVKVSRFGEQIYPELALDLKGNYQLKNLPAVLKVISVLNEKGYGISEENIYEGLRTVTKTTGLMGRWQVIGNNPLVICDTGHNEDGIKAIVAQLKNTAFKELHFIFGTVSDKDPGNVLKLLPKNAKYYFTKADMPRSMNEKDLMDRAAEFGLKGESYPTVKEAFKRARKNADKRDLIFVGGSTFVVAEIL